MVSSPVYILDIMVCHSPIKSEKLISPELISTIFTFLSFMTLHSTHTTVLTGIGHWPNFSLEFNRVGVAECLQRVSGVSWLSPEE
uniref:Ovule protein n=1 Tax=Elaeophora elaphi TaxID=1147741 RepID=A0A0R3RXT0_9BILA